MVYEAPAEKLDGVEPARLSRVSLETSSDNGMADPAPPDLILELPKAPSLHDTGSPPSPHRPGRDYCMLHSSQGA